MATIQPNLPNVSITAQLTGSTGAAAAQQQAQIAGTNFGSIQSTLDQSQQALQALVAMSAGWIGIGSGLGIGDGSLNSLGAALSTQYMAMTMGSPGFASDLTSLESPLRYMYGGLAGGAADNFQAMAAPLAGSYAGLMQIQGMPPTPPL
ncbi:MAG: hypothetical protein KF760_35165 [Candidatus Eremiobacteraeota bacterium]|nr:hypothetical protein [Candidatus Eremiobacteraeota bacterium]MCW5870216.1 hypothetical protein [Candidatus Eremiobacteraeota bacterium]